MAWLTHLWWFLWFEWVGLQQAFLLLFDFEDRIVGVSVVLDFLLYIVASFDWAARMYLAWAPCFVAQWLLWVVSASLNLLQGLLFLEWVVVWSVAWLKLRRGFTIMANSRSDEGCLVSEILWFVVCLISFVVLLTLFCACMSGPSCCQACTTSFRQVRSV